MLSVRLSVHPERQNMDVTFLYAPQRLVKTISLLANGEIRKSAYPHAKNFTSETVDVTDDAAVVRHSLERRSATPA